MILPYFLSLRRSLSHILPNTLSLSLFLSLYEQFSRSLPFILSRSLSLSLSLFSMYLYQYYLIDILIHVLNIVANI